MRAEIRRRKLKMRGDSEFGSRLAQGSIHLGDDSEASPRRCIRDIIPTLCSGFRGALHAPGSVAGALRTP